MEDNPDKAWEDNKTRQSKIHQERSTRSNTGYVDDSGVLRDYWYNKFNCTHENLKHKRVINFCESVEERLEF